MEMEKDQETVENLPEEDNGLAKDNTEFHKWKYLFAFIFILALTCIYFGYAHISSIKQESLFESSKNNLESSIADEQSSVSNEWSLPDKKTSTYPKLYNTERYRGNDAYTRFYRENDVVYLQDTKNMSLKEPLPFVDADPETFRHIERFVGLDESAIFFAYYDRELSTYVASSSKFSPEEYSLLELYGSNSTISSIWLRQPDLIEGEIKIKQLSSVLLDQLRKDFVEVSDQNGPLMLAFANSIHAKTLKSTNDGFLLFDTEGLYEIRTGAEPELILEKESKYIYHVSGSSNVYYLEDYSAPNIFKFYIPTKTTTQVKVADDRDYVRTTNIFVTADESRVYTRASWNENGSEGYLPSNSAMLEIDTSTGDVISEIPYEIKKHGSLYPFAVSPNKKYVYNIPIPYEGYLFAEMEYFERGLGGSWSASSTAYENFRLEVGGGWNVRTGQWALSPDQSLLAISDAKELYTTSCPGMGDSPSIQNQLKILVLDELESVVVREVGQWEEFAISHWNENGTGLYFWIVTFEPGTCNRESISDLQYIEI